MDNIDPKSVCLAGALIIGLIVLVNAGLWAYYRRSNPSQQAKMMRNTARTARDPWSKENEELNKLNTLVNDLRSSSSENKPPDSESSPPGGSTDEKRS